MVGKIGKIRAPIAKLIRLGKLPSQVFYSGLLTAAILLIPQLSRADEGGVSFWVPGLFGSLAAAPQQPGWSFASIYYHTSVSAGGDIALAREFQKRDISLTFSGTASASVNAKVDL